MVDHHASIWALAGRPGLGALVPARRSPGWQGAMKLLRQAVAPSFPLPQIRTWAALWSLLFSTPPPLRVNWYSLIGNITVGELRQRVEAVPKLSGINLASWNVRWLLSPHTDKAAAKRTISLNHLIAGRIVCLQETHWHHAAAAQWQGLFPAAAVVPAPARLGPGNGWQGGVATLIPC
jgi:hypothetical protein